jgi:hypothetical protein
VDARRAFLADLEAELTTPAVTKPRRPIRTVGRLAAGVVAGVSFLALTSGGASAAPAQPSTALGGTGDCYQPNHVPYTHTKQCVGITWVKHIYLYDYSPNGGVTICYVFNSEINNPCGGGTKDSESCARA